jgi:hypothetical protein
MPKKRSTSSRSVKMQRQAKALARRRGEQFKTDWQSTIEAFDRAVLAGVFQVMTEDGETRDLTLDRIRAYTDARLAADGEDPVTLPELAQFLGEDLGYGSLRVRPDGLWESDTDYFELSETS